MKIYQDLIFEKIKEEDISILTPIMKRAFDEDARIHLGNECGGPPGYDNGDFLRKYALHKDSTAFKISMNGRVIGAIIIWINNSTNHNFLGIFIDVDLQRGSAKSLEFVEHNS